MGAPLSGARRRHAPLAAHAHTPSLHGLVKDTTWHRQWWLLCKEKAVLLIDSPTTPPAILCQTQVAQACSLQAACMHQETPTLHEYIHTPPLGWPTIKLNTEMYIKGGEGRLCRCSGNDH